MQFAEIAENFLAERERAGAAGMIPVRRAGFYRRGHRRAQRRFDERDHIGLGIERIGGMRGFRPAANAGADTNAGGDVRLRAGHAAFELRADFGQNGNPRNSARRLRGAAASSDGNTLGRSASRSDGDGIFQLPRVIAATEELRLRARDEGIGNRFAEAARRQRAPNKTALLLLRRQHGLAPRHAGARIGIAGTLSRP